MVTWLGAAGSLLYNSLMFVFATPANRLFPLYLAMLGLSAWSAGALLRQADVAALGALFSPRTPARGIAVYMWATVVLNAAAWLARIVPAVVRGGAPAYLRGTGLTTSVVYVQDLALWLPLLAVAAAWLWRRRSWGYLLAGRAADGVLAPRPGPPPSPGFDLLRRRRHAREPAGGLVLRPPAQLPPRAAGAGGGRHVRRPAADRTRARPRYARQAPTDTLAALYRMAGLFGWTSLPWLWAVGQPTLIVAGGGHLVLLDSAAQVGPVITGFLREG